MQEKEKEAKGKRSQGEGMVAAKMGERCFQAVDGGTTIRSYAFVYCLQ